MPDEVQEKFWEVFLTYVVKFPHIIFILAFGRFTGNLWIFMLTSNGGKKKKKLSILRENLTITAVGVLPTIPIYMAFYFFKFGLTTDIDIAQLMDLTVISLLSTGAILLTVFTITTMIRKDA